MTQEGPKTGREQAVFVFWPLCPSRKQIAEFEPAWWLEASGDAPVFGFGIHTADLATANILTNVIQVDINGGCVSPA